jgi:hypothetical protein
MERMKRGERKGLGRIERMEKGMKKKKKGRRLYWKDSPCPRKLPPHPLSQDFPAFYPCLPRMCGIFRIQNTKHFSGSCQITIGGPS